MLVYAVWEFFSREHRGQLEKQRAQACTLLLVLLVASYIGVLAA